MAKRYDKRHKRNKPRLTLPKPDPKNLGNLKPKLKNLKTDLKTVKPLLKTNVHLGNKVNQWNPKMQPFLHSKSLRFIISDKKQLKLHVLDAVKIMKHMIYVAARITKTTAETKKTNILFVGTDNKYKTLISKTAQACNAYYVNEKWLGGMLTNWDTIELLTDRLRKYDLLIRQGVIDQMPKKEAAKAYREKNKLQNRLEGVKFMMARPDLVIVMGQLQEMKALKECKKLHIPSICFVNTNCNPMISDLVIPANDNSMIAIKNLTNIIVQSVKRGQLIREEKKKPKQFKRLYKTKPKPRPRKGKPKGKGKSSFKSKNKKNNKITKNDN